MGAERVSSCLAAAALLIVLSGPAFAQQGTVTGRVTDATTLDPVPLARISVVGGESDAVVVSQRDGSFELRLDAGIYDLLVEAEDFAATRFDRVSVLAGQTTARNLLLESQGYRLAGFIVTASRGAIDTEITAPSSSHSISDIEIAERPAASPVEHLRELSAVDVMTQGIQASNVVVRGFNNVFSGALHMLTDNRLAGLPALRVNLMHFLPSNDDDIDRTEVVLGPGSALYGPNTANGVVHVITKSPLESQGTTVSLGAGERSVFHGTFRSAFLIAENLGVKVSGQVLSGKEWAHVDSTELRAREGAAANWDACVDDRQHRGLAAEEAETACGRIGRRNPWIRRYGLEARADWRFSRRGTLVTTYGRTDASGIELTPLSAAQTENWIHQFVQTRLTYDRWFMQAYFNANDAGETFLLRDGPGLIDRSTLAVAQIQNGFSFADERFDFTYGWDYFVTRPDSRGTIYGDYEDKDEVREWGVYLQSKTALSSKIDLIAAGRVDSHSILPEKVLSPRLTLLVKPSDDHAVRFAYNRAFSTPTALNYFLDLGTGFAPGDLGSLGYTTRAFGSGRKGFAWQNPDGSLRGMRSPFNPDPGGPAQFLPADPATLWRLGLGEASRRSPLPQDVLAVLEGLSPGASEVDILYLDVKDPTQGLRPLSGLVLPDVPPIKESNTETFEVGWSGVWANSVRVSADVYYMKRNDFVSPLTVETPLLHLDRVGLEGWLGPAYIQARVDDLVAGGLTNEAATAQATTEAAAIVPILADGVGQLPLAVAS
ncbi:MAG TPA: TonB-dependent receptor, partial [Longimicrobiales bacterium]|nr:TonB-dependent receptor [Longimicrobiales bacterium]